MNNNDFKEISERKISGKQMIVPIVVATLFILLVGGVSYAYFGFNSVSTNNTTYMNAAFPAKTNKTVSVTKQDCALTVAHANMVSGQANNTTPKWTGTCSVTITINGSVGDTCSYNVSLVNGTKTYAKSVTLAANTFEYSGTLSGSATKAETNMDDLANAGVIAGSQSISVAAANTAVSKTYTLTTKFYNLAGVDQKALLSDSAAQTYRHLLEITSLSCNMNH